MQSAGSGHQSAECTHGESNDRDVFVDTMELIILKRIMQYMGPNAMVKLPE